MAMVHLQPLVMLALAMLALASSQSHLAAVLVALKELAPLFPATAAGGKSHKDVVDELQHPSSSLQASNFYILSS